MLVCGDVIVSSVPPHWYMKPITAQIVKEQKRRGYLRTDGTHVVRYLGKLPVAWLTRAAQRSKISPDSFYKLREGTDWCLSTTWPKTVLVSFEKDVHPKGHYRCYNRTQDTIGSRDTMFYSSVTYFYLREAALEILGTAYDPGQLVDFMLNRWGHTPRSHWRRLLDLGRTRLVCSVAAYLMEEYARKSWHSNLWQPFIDFWGDPVAPDSVLPADFENSRWYHLMDEVE